MKIGNVSGVGGVQNTSGANKVKKAAQVESKRDVVSISGPAKDYAFTNKILTGISDVSERANEIKKLYEAGAYDVKEEDIAVKLAKAMVGNKH